MPIIGKEEFALPPEALNLPEVEYPPEVVERWKRKLKSPAYK